MGINMLRRVGNGKRRREKDEKKMKIEEGRKTVTIT